MKIVVYGQYSQNKTSEVLENVLSFFSKNNAELFLECSLYEGVNDSFDELNLIGTDEKLDASFDYLISIGGDGTVLRSATVVADSGVPILAINTGRLGFLANVHAELVELSLKKLINKEYSFSPRTLLELKCEPENNAFSDCNYALNEVTVSRKDTTSMITIETLLNGEYLNSYWADGLIVSTPTGSTGYSLSCGGPVLMPGVSSIAINPIAPHNLNARPLVVTDDTEIQLKVSGREGYYLVSLDSRIATVSEDTILHIKKKPFKINMVQLNDDSFLKTLREKLLWGEDKRN